VTDLPTVQGNVNEHHITISATIIHTYRSFRIFQGRQ
jgi:hypothetical protein